MKLAVIGDIHSNIYALEKVLEDINSKNVDFIICTGDIVGYGPFPNEVIDLVRKNHILAIQGNHDMKIGNIDSISDYDNIEQKDLDTSTLSVIFTFRELTKENKNYLNYLPSQLKFKIEDKELLVVHGSPRKINEYLFANSETVKEVTENMKEDILICAHTHKPYFEIINDKYIINSGSVGKPKHGNPNATYVIVEVEGEKVEANINEVEYDVEKMVQAIIDNDILPNKFADMLRKG